MLGADFCVVSAKIVVELEDHNDPVMVYESNGCDITGRVCNAHSDRVI